MRVTQKVVAGDTVHLKDPFMVSTKAIRSMQRVWLHRLKVPIRVKCKRERIKVKIEPGEACLAEIS